MSTDLLQFARFWQCRQWLITKHHTQSDPVEVLGKVHTENIAAETLFPVSIFCHVSKLWAGKCLIL